MRRLIERFINDDSGAFTAWIVGLLCFGLVTLIGIQLVLGIDDPIGVETAPRLESTSDTTVTGSLIPPAVIENTTTTATTAAPTTTSLAQEYAHEYRPTNAWTWDKLADCESGEWTDRNGNGEIDPGEPIPGSADWSISDGVHEGGLQFAPQTWDGFRDDDMPEAAYLASREVQIVVAERVLAQQGPGAWPICSYVAGLR